MAPFASDAAIYFRVSAWGSCIRPTALPVPVQLPVFLANDIAQMCFRSLLTADSGKNRVLGRSGNGAAHFLFGPRPNAGVETSIYCALPVSGAL